MTALPSPLPTSEIAAHPPNEADNGHEGPSFSSDRANCRRIGFPWLLSESDSGPAA